jgi:hypothetical protein
MKKFTVISHQYLIYATEVEAPTAKEAEKMVEFGKVPHGEQIDKVELEIIEVIEHSGGDEDAS